MAKHYRLETYPHQIEVITSEQMMDAYSSVGMPINYAHWSFGKKFIETEQRYKHGQQGLAYEIVINSNPCIAYLMEENTITMQALVIAHACYGHNSFFKITTCSAAGPTPVRLLITCCLRKLYRRMRGALRGRRGRAVARFLSCADELRRRSLQASAEDFIAGRESAAEKS